MKLEDWVKKDMTRYIKDHEPELESDAPVRQEDYGMLGKKDYERHIKRALKQGRFKEATKQFDELKEQFTAIPVDHQQERKHYYRILQKAYKQIYDWVEDRHKTHRLLDNLEGDGVADVFDDSVQAKDLNKDAAKPENAPPTIEDQMFRKQPKMPDFDDGAQMPSMPDADNPFAQSKEQSSQPEMPEAPEGMQEAPAAAQTENDAKDNQRHKQPVKKQTGSNTSKHKKPSASDKQPREASIDEEHGPSWQPPGFDFTPRKPKTPRTPKPSPRQKKPKQPPSVQHVRIDEEEANPGWKPPTLEFPSHKQPRRKKRSIDEQSVFSSAAHELVTQARRALANDDAQTAKTKLIEARFEAQRGHNNKALRAVEALERQLAASSTVDYKPPKDKELFSTLYLQGVHAMHDGDYQKAAQLFAKRISQAPQDHAARIRYQECQEAIQ